MQAQLAEQARRARGEGRVGPGEDGTHVGGRIVAGQRLPPAPGVVQLLRQGAQARVGAHRRVRGDEGQRQRQAGTAADDLGDGVRLGGGPAGTQPVGQQVARLVRGERVEAHRVGAVRGDQAGELVAAGHQDQAAGGAG